MPERSLRLGLSVTLMLAACGGDEGDPPGTDGGADASAETPPLHCPAEPHARFQIHTDADSGDFTGQYDDVPWPSALEEKVREGDCSFWAPEPPFCDPACPSGELCAAGSVCRRYPERTDVGPLHVTGTQPELEVVADPASGLYFAGPDLPDLYQTGDEITLTGGGTGGIDEFSLTVRGVPPLEVTENQFIAREHEDLTVTWTADPATPPGTQVLVIAAANHHGLEARIDCQTEDDGELVIPATLVDPLIQAGLIGTYPVIEPIRLIRVNRAMVDTDRGCAIFDSFSGHTVEVFTAEYDGDL